LPANTPSELGPPLPWVVTGRKALLCRPRATSNVPYALRPLLLGRASLRGAELSLRGAELSLRGAELSLRGAGLRVGVRSFASACGASRRRAELRVGVRSFACTCSGLRLSLVGVSQLAPAGRSCVERRSRTGAICQFHAPKRGRAARRGALAPPDVLVGAPARLTPSAESQRIGAGTATPFSL
jgi:hypothetical protein